jgi:hypothetical protein
MINSNSFAQHFDSESVFTERDTKFAHDRLMQCRLHRLETEDGGCTETSAVFGRGLARWKRLKSS